MRYLKTIAVMAVAVAAMVHPASADTIRYDATLTPFSSGPTPFSYTATFQQWNAASFGAGATLNSVTFYLSSTIGGTFSFSATADNQDIYSDSKIAGTVSLGSLVTVFPTIYLAGSGAATVFQTLSNGQTITPIASGTLAGTDGNTGAITTGLGAYTGSGTFGINGTGSARATTDTGSNVNTSVSASVDVTAYVIYDYTVPPPPNVPEPASMALLGSGLIGLGAMVRRRRRG